MQLSVTGRALFKIAGLPITDIIVFTWVVMALLVATSLVLTRSLRPVPKGAQNIAEVIVEGFDHLVHNIMGDKGRPYVPLIMSIGLFVLVSNLISIVPALDSPTKSLNTTLALGVIVLVVAHASEIKRKGLWTYIKGYFEPFWWMFPLNIVGEVAKLLSHSFRLYGNIIGGSIIIAIIVSFAPLLVPVPFTAWFGIFTGVVQAAVFTLLAAAYIALRLE